MVKKKESTKVKKKSWVQILAPKTYQNQNIGESYVSTATNLLSRHIAVNLMTLTRDIKKQNINASFEVSEVKENKAFTKMIGYKLMPAAIRRLVRRRKNKIADSVILKSKDGVLFRIKLIIITQFRVSRAISSAIRTQINDHFKEFASKNEFERFLSEMLTNRFQRSLKDEVKKIAPVKIIDVTYIKETKLKKQ